MSENAFPTPFSSRCQLQHHPKKMLMGEIRLGEVLENGFLRILAIAQKGAKREKSPFFLRRQKGTFNEIDA